MVCEVCFTVLSVFKVCFIALTVCWVCFYSHLTQQTNYRIGHKGSCVFETCTCELCRATKGECRQFVKCAFHSQYVFPGKFEILQHVCPDKSILTTFQEQLPGYAEILTFQGYPAKLFRPYPPPPPSTARNKSMAATMANERRLTAQKRQMSNPGGVVVSYFLYQGFSASS